MSVPPDESGAPQESQEKASPKADDPGSASDGAGQSSNDGPAEVSTGDLDKVRQMRRKTRPTRTDVDSDYDGHNASGTQVPGLDAFRGLRGIAPFLWLVCAYAEAQHSRRKTPQSKLDQFVREHPIRVKVAFYLDLSLQAVLVLFLLIVVARGVGLIDLIERIDAVFNPEPTAVSG